MKKHTLPVSLCLALLCLALFALTGCKKSTVPPVAIIGGKQEGPVLYLPQQLFASAFQQVSLEAQYIEPAEDLSAQLQGLADSGHSVVILQLRQSAGAARLVEVARSGGISLVLYGAQPSEEVMNSYDKVWYVGTTVQQGGEALGCAASELYRSGAIPDYNEDHLLQYARFNDEANPGAEEICRYTISSFADYGIFSEMLYEDIATDEKTAVEITRALLVQEKRFELALCQNAQAAAGVRSELDAQGLSAGGQTPVPAIIAFGTKNDLKPMVESGALLAAVCPDEEGICSAVVQIAKNAAGGRSATADTDYRLDAFKTVRLPYIVYTTSTAH